MTAVLIVLVVCGVAQALRELDDPGITPGTTGYFRGNRAEQLSNGILILQIAEHYPALMRGVVLGFRDQGLHIGPQGFRLGQRGNDLLVCDQLAGHIAQQRSTM